MADNTTGNGRLVTGAVGGWAMAAAFGVYAFVFRAIGFRGMSGQGEMLLVSCGLFLIGGICMFVGYGELKRRIPAQSGLFNATGWLVLLAGLGLAGIITPALGGPGGREQFELVQLLMASGMIAAAIFGIVGGIAYLKANKNDDTPAGFLIAGGGLIVGGILLLPGALMMMEVIAPNMLMFGLSAAAPYPLAIGCALAAIGMTSSREMPRAT